MVGEVVYSVTELRMKEITAQVKHLKNLQVKIDIDSNKMKDDALSKYKDGINWLWTLVSEITQEVDYDN